MDEDKKQKVIVVKVYNPVEVLACNQQLATETSKILDNAMRVNGQCRPSMINVNEMYAIVECRVWKRVVVIEKVTVRDAEIKVKYVDYGLQGLTTLTKLIVLPEKLKVMEPAARKYTMRGLVPVAMSTVFTGDRARPVQAKPSVCKSWSEASHAWFQRVIEDNDKQLEVRPLGPTGSSGQLHCEMFLRPDGVGELRSVAELLLEQNFAARSQRRSPSPGAVSPPPNGPRENSPSGSSDDLSTSEQNLMQCSANGEAPLDGERLDLARMERAVFRLSPVRAPSPILSFDRSPLAVSIKRCLAKHKVSCLLFIQAHMTPIILRGMDVLAVAPPRKGKTTGLLMPLLTRICNMAENATTVCDGRGPIAIVVCPSWSMVRQCADYAHEFVKQSPTRLTLRLKIVAAYGGVNDVRAELDMTDGCDLLVATPRLLVRLIDKQLLDFSRLETIAMDGIDVLAEFYLEEVKKIILSRKRKTSRSRTHQVIATASAWTPAVTSFSKVCMNNAVEVYAMGGVMEACLRMKMPHYLLPWTKDAFAKLETLLSFLMEVDLAKDAVVICTTSSVSASNIYRFLQERFAWEKVMMLGEEETSEEHKLHLTAAWRAHMREGKRRPVLIAWDYQNAPPLNIRDASVLIHYDLASKADAFFRYHFVRAAMEQFDSEEPLGARCYFMCNQRRWAESPVRTCPDRIVEVVGFLQKTLPGIPEELQQLAHNRKAAMDIIKGSSVLCPHLSSFGQCRLPFCRERHIVLGDVDRPLLPISGEVEFQLINVKAANWLFVRLLTHKTDATDPGTDYRPSYLSLQTELNDFFLKSENQRMLTLSEIRPGLVVAVTSATAAANQFRRARVLALVQRKRERKVSVMLLDEGRSLLVDPERLLELPQSLQAVPAQAVELIVSRFQPLDEDIEFTPEASEFAAKLIDDRVFFGRIALCMGSTLWMHSIAERVHHRATNVRVIDNDLRMVLIDKGLAVENLDHLKRLTALCRGQADIMSLTQPRQFLSRRFTYDNVPLDFSQLDEEVTVALCGYLESPEFFFVIKDDLYDDLWEMIDEIAEHWSSVRRFPSRCLASGTLALCCWDKTQEWNRAMVLETLTDSEPNQQRYRVRFIDFGETDIVAWEALRQLPDQFRRLPATGIECSLANCRPSSAEGWSPKTQSVLMDFCYIDNNRQPLNVKVVVKRSSNEAWTHYVVDIVQEENELNLTQHLILEGLALGTVELAELIFPQGRERIPPLLRRLSPFHIAFDLFKCLDSRCRLDLSETLFQTVTNWPRVSLGVRRRYSAGDLPEVMAKLLRFCSQELELYFLYRALVAALELEADSCGFAESETAVALVPHTIRHLQRLTELQEQDMTAEQSDRLLMAMAAVLTVCVSGGRTAEAFLHTPSWSAVLSAALSATRNTEPVMRRFLELLTALPTKINVEDAVLLAKTNLALLQRLPLHSSLWAASLQLLAKQSQLSGAMLRALLAAEAMELLWARLEEFRMSELPGPDLLDAFVSAAAELWLRGDQRRRVHFVKSADRRPVIDWLVTNSAGPQVGALVFDMKTEISRVQRTGTKELELLLRPKNLQTVVLKPRISPAMITIGATSRPPIVKWFQGRKFVFLTIAVSKLHTMKTCPVIMTDRSVHFTCFSQGESLAFDLILCYAVEPRNSLVKLSEFEVRVKIRKVEVGVFWAHLTSSRPAPSWLTKDLEHVDYQIREEPKAVVEEAEETSGFTLPCVAEKVNRQVAGAIERSRLRYRRRMRRLGRAVVGRPPDIDAGAWLRSQGAKAFFSPLGTSVTAASELSHPEEEEDDEYHEQDDFDNESSDDSFYDESDSDLELLDEGLENSARNPATEDCLDHYNKW